LFTAAARGGIERAFADGNLVATDDPPKLARTREHTIDLLIAGPCELRRLDEEDIQRALRWGRGALKLRSEAGKEQLFSSAGACPTCAFSSSELDPRWFSFATKQGRCETCEGAGALSEEVTSGRGKKCASTASAITSSVRAPSVRRSAACASWSSRGMQDSSPRR
jgi:excinuclease ABC subunit A